MRDFTGNYYIIPRISSNRARLRVRGSKNSHKISLLPANALRNPNREFLLPNRELNRAFRPDQGKRPLTRVCGRGGRTRRPAVLSPPWGFTRQPVIASAAGGVWRRRLRPPPLTADCD